MKMDIFELLTSTVVLFGSGIVFIQPLRKRENWLRWLPAMFGVCLLSMWLIFVSSGGWTVASCLIQYLSLIVMVLRCTKLSLPGASYCAVWAIIASQADYELWLGFRMLLPQLHGSLLARLVSVLLFSAAVFLIINRTVARWMPHKDVYQIGPRQLGSALLLGTMFTSMAYYFLEPHERSFSMSLVLILCQVYCVSLLYLQTELFKKSRMEKELNALNFLYSCEQQQFAAARQNVSMVTSKCEELEQMIRQMQQYLPQELRQENRNSLEDAIRACDTMVKTGNDVLDIVLTEKNLLAQASGIQVNCVADGKLLDFMEVVDIYAMFSNALDNAIEAVEKLPERSHRLIDVLVHENQNFLVINISNPLKASLEFEEDLPVTTKSKKGFHGYGLRVLRHAVEKYHGMISIETAGGFFTLKVLIPLSQRKK